MTAYIARRLLLMVPVIFGILLLTFAIKALIPSDAVAALFEGQVTEEQSAEAAAAIRHKYGLDRPWYVQFADYSGKVLTGDLGESIRTISLENVLTEALAVVEASLARPPISP